ncbi:hypothetical protein OG874_13265 [Nocardia sp. NBC_00565]|uniref:hypothetical protein n=1 Tax=Nocardia sp. NBC_00565 TaxID=2975993 RepID=UPI002E81531D|nr:hypothetical protein [Nocardia sp. NBC_00565]WUC06040.1 hypothetical protein OG874_13265 [Nocardia sp. NBC_00565]
MTARADLEHELGGPVAALDQLSDTEAADLLSMFRDARAAETAGLTAAVDRLVGALPWPLRTAAKKVMFGNRLG